MLTNNGISLVKYKRIIHCTRVHFLKQITFWPSCPGVGVTKAPFVKFSVSKIFDLAKVPLRLFESHLYLTSATAAELRRHLSNINVIFNS